MTAVILDTDILSEILKAKDPMVLARLAKYGLNFDQITFSSASVWEILSGYRKRNAPAQAERATQLFDQNRELVPEAADYRLAAEINGDLLRKGRVVGMVDPLIAASAIRRGFGVSSGNTAHFNFIREAGYDFHLENWRDASPG
jgi:predicted nucleic acid-binding protein